jgi:hypothetical protein
MECRPASRVEAQGVSLLWPERTAGGRMWWGTRCGAQKMNPFWLFIFACENSESFSFGFPGWFLGSTEEIKRTCLGFLFLGVNHFLAFLAWSFAIVRKENNNIISCYLVCYLSLGFKMTFAHFHDLDPVLVT